MEKLNVAIADDNERMTDILGQMIEEDKELALVGKAHNGEEICNIIREKEPGKIWNRHRAGAAGYDHAENGRTDRYGAVQS